MEVSEEVQQTESALLASIRRGIADSAAGRVHDLGSFIDRPWCCPEPRCMPLHTLVDDDGMQPGNSFVCFGKAPEVEFSYDGIEHRNDLRHCDYTPLKGLIAYQENESDWQALKTAYWRALSALDTHRAQDGQR